MRVFHRRPDLYRSFLLASSLILAPSLAHAMPLPDRTPSDPDPLPPLPVAAPVPHAALDAPVPVPDPEPEPLPLPVAAPQELLVVPATGFEFGSYGRVLAGSDLRGHTPEKIAVVAHAPRIVEPSYVETDFYYRFAFGNDDVSARTVTTLAFDDTLFHYTGQFDARPALRNLFLEVNLPPNLTVWAGSRMYRGDDLYLFDYWPLDDLNTLGAGVEWRPLPRLQIAAHAGVNRLLDPFQYQTKEVSDPSGIGSVTATQLDRQRTVGSLAITHFVDTRSQNQAKVKAYLEVQGLPTGSRRREDSTLEELPADYGLSLGLQLGWWTQQGFLSGSHANLFARWSKGLTAFDELAAPSGLDDRHAVWPGASEIVVGAGTAINQLWGNVAAAAYARRFVDADDSTQDRDDGWEYAVDVRPEVKLTRHLMAGADVSYQVRFPRGLSPTTLLAADPAVLQIAPMLVLTPAGNRTFDRPQLRLVWRIARLNEAAIDEYPVDDPRREHDVVHFLGVQAEWWFNSSTR
jgi:maltoporin